MKSIATFFCLLFAAKSLAQLPPQCPPVAEPPVDDCQNICAQCRLDTLRGSTAGYSPEFVQSFCGTIENNQWIGFVAGATSATFTIVPSNCANGNGVQLALLRRCGSLIMDCAMGCSGCGEVPIGFGTHNLEIGQFYYLMVDGFAGDQCDFILTVDPPDAILAPVLDNLGAVFGPDTTCAGNIDTFFVQPVPNAGGYVWTAPAGATINGLPSPATLDRDSGTRVAVRWGSEPGPVCARATNICHETSASCREVAFRGNTASLTVLPDVEICGSAAPYYFSWGDSAWWSGTYEGVLSNVFGCDSIVRQALRVLPPIQNLLGEVYLCEGECLTVFGKDYCQPYLSQSLYGLTAGGCDSLVSFTLVPVPKMVAKIEPPASPTITCAEPSVALVADSAYWFYSYQWTDNQGVVVGNQRAISVSEPGLYTLRVASTTGPPGCRSADKIFLKENTALPDLTASGGALDAQHPTVQLAARSKSFPVNFRWTGPNGFASNLRSPIVSAPGFYTVTATNPQTGCASTKTVEVKQQ